MGFPIRKSPGQSLFAALRGLSQLATSFIAVLRQGIHRTPLIACYATTFVLLRSSYLLMFVSFFDAVRLTSYSFR